MCVWGGGQEYATIRTTDADLSEKFSMKLNLFSDHILKQFKTDKFMGHYHQDYQLGYITGVRRHDKFQ